MSNKLEEGNTWKENPNKQKEKQNQKYNTNLRFCSTSSGIPDLWIEGEIQFVKTFLPPLSENIFKNKRKWIF